MAVKVGLGCSPAELLCISVSYLTVFLSGMSGNGNFWSEQSIHVQFKSTSGLFISTSSCLTCSILPLGF